MLKPVGDWILVRLHPIPEKTGSLFTVHGGRVRTAEVLAVGPGSYARDTDKRIPLGVEIGETVVFFREHLETKQGKTIVKTLDDFGDDLGLIKVTDVLFVTDGEGTIDT